MRRCGADAERLALLGYDVDRLARHHFSLEEMLTGFELDWDRLLAFGFRIELLGNREHFPAVAPIDHAPLRVNYRHVLRYSAASYDSLAALRLSQEELYVLGFRAPLLLQLNMSGEQLARALADDDGVKARGYRWWVGAFELTRRQLDAMPIDRRCVQQDARLQAAYAGLLLVLGAIQQ